MENILFTDEERETMIEAYINHEDKLYISINDRDKDNMIGFAHIVLNKETARLLAKQILKEIENEF